VYQKALGKREAPFLRCITNKERTMMAFFKKSLEKRLITYFLLCALIPIIIVSLLSFYSAREALTQQAFNELKAITENKRQAILNYLENLGKEPL
jgi:uncharacterized BrkB/YihY/UPF0761 family membrane protein